VLLLLLPAVLLLALLFPSELDVISSEDAVDAALDAETEAD
jgi:hypothetical protein